MVNHPLYAFICAKGTRSFDDPYNGFLGYHELKPDQKACVAEANACNGGVSTSKIAGPPMTANNTHNQAGRCTELGGNRAYLKNAWSLWAENYTLLLVYVWWLNTLGNKVTLDRNTKLKSNMRIQKTML